MVIHGCKDYPCRRCHYYLWEIPELKAEIARLRELICELVPDDEYGYFCACGFLSGDDPGAFGRLEAHLDETGHLDHGRYGPHVGRRLVDIDTWLPKWKAS